MSNMEERAQLLETVAFFRALGFMYASCIIIYINSFFKTIFASLIIFFVPPLATLHLVILEGGGYDVNDGVSIIQVLVIFLIPHTAFYYNYVKFIRS